MKRNESTEERVSCSPYHVGSYKGLRWMPWCQVPKKDVGHCEKLRVAVNRRLSRRYPNGETRWSEPPTSAAEYIGGEKGTWGTETSKYPEEKRVFSE
jgi:hypothetical protein